MKKTTKHGIVLEDTPQYKILNKGRQSTSNAELLATIISSGNHAKDLTTAQKILFESCSCGGHLVERKNKANGNKFLGCTNYPKCTKTKSI